MRPGRGLRERGKWHPRAGGGVVGRRGARRPAAGAREGETSSGALTRTGMPAKAAPHLQVDGALQGEGLGLLDILVAKLGDPPGPARLRTIGWNHRHAGELRKWRGAETESGETFPVRAAVIGVPLSSRRPPLTGERNRRRTHAGSESGLSGGGK